MVVMAPRQNWTDERLDHFEKRVDERFDRVDERFDRVDERFTRVDERFTRVDTDIRELRQAVSQVQTTIVIGFVGLAGLIASGQVFF